MKRPFNPSTLQLWILDDIHDDATIIEEELLVKYGSACGPQSDFNADLDQLFVKDLIKASDHGFTDPSFNDYHPYLELTMEGLWWYYGYYNDRQNKS